MAKPKTFGLVGNPVKHSLSPLMHNAAFKALNIPAEYKLFEVKPEDLNTFLYDLDKLNIYGLNVTVPYKERAMDFVELPVESFYLRQVRAVNTIVKRNNRWQGFNTDIPGFEKHLKENFDPKGKRCAVLGAGGASRAVAYVLAKAGARDLAIFDIDKQKTENVCAMVDGLLPGFNVSCVDSIDKLEINNKDLLVNSTPVGMKAADPLIVDSGLLHKNLFVYDLIYNPVETKLLKEARARGARTANGLGMLLYQGALSFEYFTGEKAPVEVMREALTEGVKTK
ncbi:MAG: shikimate dehydrogenase [Candidatus Omnitrophica bacterium]|nr:shikimate dehydrogenase [Candidatus Omnitrophota bacterium]